MAKVPAGELIDLRRLTPDSMSKELQNSPCPQQEKLPPAGDNAFPQSLKLLIIIASEESKGSFVLIQTVLQHSAKHALIIVCMRADLHLTLIYV